MVKFIVAGVVLVAVLGFFFSGITSGDPGPSPVVGTPKTLDQIPLMQAAHFHLPPTGKAHNLTLPSNLGFAITEISTSLPATSFKPVTVSVNGLVVCKRVIGSDPNYVHTASFTPPILVPPGGTLTLTYPLPNDMDLTVGGYFLTLADLGLQ